MSVIKLNFGSGQAAAYFDLKKAAFVTVGPNAIKNNTVAAHPSFIRLSYQSHSGLSGEVVMADSGLISPVSTYRPQHFEYLSGDDLIYPLVPVDRNDTLLDYPVIYACSIFNGCDIQVTAGDITLPILDGCEVDSSQLAEQTEILTYRHASGKDCRASITVNFYGELSKRKFYTAFRFACFQLRKSEFAYSVDKTLDTRHPTGLAVWLDKNGTWFLVNEYGLYVNVGSDDPVAAWASTGHRPRWAPDHCEVFDLDDNLWGVLSSQSITYFSERGIINEKYLNVKERIDVINVPRLFLDESKTVLPSEKSL